MTVRGERAWGQTGAQVTVMQTQLNKTKQNKQRKKHMDMGHQGAFTA